MSFNDNVPISDELTFMKNSCFLGISCVQEVKTFQLIEIKTLSLNITEMNNKVKYILEELISYDIIIDYSYEIQCSEYKNDLIKGEYEK